MWSKLKQVEQRYEELTMSLSSPEVVGNPELLVKYSKEHKDLSEIVETYRRFTKLNEELTSSKEMQEANDDADMAEMIREEISELSSTLEELEATLKVLLLPKDPNDDKNIILEIRAGAGGDEAAIFVGDLFRMYSRYAEDSGFKLDTMNSSYAPSGGYKEIIAMVNGNGAYSKFKYESGVHRVQRVPATESQGRIHTSTATVAVLPEAEDVEIDIDQKDLRIDVFRASGPGGQSVNTTDSAVRITHEPTGIVVSMQDEKSQHKNRDKAMKVLRSRLYDLKQAELDAERRDDRRGQVGSGDRSEKVRTYNYPQSRVTDHRIGLTLHSLDAIIDGDLNQLIEPLTTHYQAEAMKGQEDA